MEFFHYPLYLFSNRLQPHKGNEYFTGDWSCLESFCIFEYHIMYYLVLDTISSREVQILRHAVLDPM